MTISPALAEVNICLKLSHEALQLQAQLGWQPVLHEGWIKSVRQRLCHLQVCNTGFSWWAAWFPARGGEGTSAELALKFG